MPAGRLAPRPLLGGTCPPRYLAALSRPCWHDKDNRVLQAAVTSHQHDALFHASTMFSPVNCDHCRGNPAHRDNWETKSFLCASRLIRFSLSANSSGFSSMRRLLSAMSASNSAKDMIFPGQFQVLPGLLIAWAMLDPTYSHPVVVWCLFA